MTERAARLKDYVVNQLGNAGVRSSRLYDMIAASLAESEGEHLETRRAKVSVYLYDHIGMVIHPYELLAGSQLALYPVDTNLPDYEQRKAQVKDYLDQYRAKRLSGEMPAFSMVSGWSEFDPGARRNSVRFALISRDHYEANIPYDQLQRLIREMQALYHDDEILLEAEIAREVENYFNYDYSHAYELMRKAHYTVANHLSYDHGRLLQRGFGSLRDQAKRGLADAQERKDADKARFYQAALITLAAAIRYIYRYADFAEAEAGKTADGERKAQLLEIAGRMRRIAEQRPQNFKDAIQLLWLEFILSNIPGGNAMSLSRFDQYLYPFYINDIDAGVITRDEAKEYITDLWIKVNEPKMRTVISMILAGTTPDGKPGENELTSLCLEVLREVKTPFPNTGVRLRHDSPEWVYDAIVKTIEAGVGQPAIFNDDHWIPILQGRGYALEDARDYFNMGCVEIMIVGKQAKWHELANAAFGPAIELAFSNGKHSCDGRPGIATGELAALDTFDKFLEAVLKQLDHLIVSQAAAVMAQASEETTYQYDAFASALMSDPLERGVDMYHGGCRYTCPWICEGNGLGTAVDSLSAVKKFVYEDKLLSLAELKEVLERDFAGREDLRILLERNTPAFGNDIDEVDEIAKKLMDSYFATMARLEKTYAPHQFAISQFSYTSQVYYGEMIGALPNGRKARQPISDNAGPSQGKDTGGPTKLINSMLKKNEKRINGAYAMNMKFTPTVLKTGNGRAAMKNIIKQYFADGNGPQMQINYIDSQTLREAQADPAKHAGLVVRVAGFCEYFANLDRQLQNEIIARTEQHF